MASATAIAPVGAVMGVAQAGTAQSADDATLLADPPEGRQAHGNE
ncbi:hypothetical protein [Streptomyces sp. CC0208]|uniref:Uncharacterized protein n=1 Tax=Streptomyces sviceus (strain ATCC 29083 / DSM 924 / JCM 4929 / NBRC 13980 / NCIMB 11184 / NRRL 5439 / UC 5370) TaxID=463191 RepID=B5HXL9_STRX2|nr:hypothetical protein [Streptomyces sp. CC0208]EDY57574.1 conserved hypothetical protein [Streptomyces sviceus ATCC 29083]